MSKRRGTFILQDIQFITPDELVPLLGDTAIRMEGFSWILYDVPQFMDVSPNPMLECP